MTKESIQSESNKSGKSVVPKDVKLAPITNFGEIKKPGIVNSSPPSPFSQKSMP